MKLTKHQIERLEKNGSIQVKDVNAGKYRKIELA